MIGKLIGFPTLSKGISTSTTVADSAAVDANSAALAKNTDQKKLNNAEDLKGASTNSAHAQSEIADATATQTHTVADYEALAVLEQKGLAGAIELTQQADATTGELTEAAAIQVNTEKEKENLMAQEANNASDVKGTTTNKIKAGSELEAAGATNVHTSAILANTKAILSWLATNPVGWCILAGAAIFTVTKAYDALTVSAEEAIKKAEEIKEVHATAAAELEEHEKLVEDIAESYEELSKGVDTKTNKNLSLSDEEYQEYLDITNQLAEAFPSLQATIDSNGNAIINLGKSGRTAAEDLEYLLQKEEDLNNFKISLDIDDLFAGAKASLDKTYAELVELENIKSLQQQNLDYVNDLFYGKTDFTHDAFDTKDYSAQIFNIYDESTKHVQDMWQDIYDEFNQYLVDTGSDNLQAFQTTSDLFINEANESFNLHISTTMLNEDEREALHNMVMIKADEYQSFIQQEVNNAFNDFDLARLDAELEWSEFLESLTASTKSKASYKSLQDNMFGEEIQNIADLMIQNLDYKVSDEMEEQGAYEWVRNNIISPLSKLSVKERKEVISIYDQLLQFNPDDLTTDNQKMIDKLIYDLSELTNLSSAELKINLGFDVDDDYEIKFNESINNSIRTFKTAKEEIEQVFSDLEIDSSNELDLWNDAVEVSKTLEEAIETYLSVKPSDFNFDELVTKETEALETYTTALSESISAAGLTDESISNIIKRYKDLEEYNEADLFEKTVQGIHLNAQELKKLEKAYEDANNEAMDNELDSLEQQYQDLTEQIREATSAEEEATLYAQRENVVSQINDITKLKAQYEGLTSAYTKWQNAQSDGDNRDGYESIVSSREEIEEEMKRGWLDDGTKAYIDLLSSQDLATASLTEYGDAFKQLRQEIGDSGFSIFDFFTKDDDGNSTAEGIYNFFDTVRKVVGETYSWIDENGDYHFDFSGIGDQFVADALGIDIEAMQIILRSALDAGFNVNLDSYGQAFDTITEDAREALDVLYNIEDLEFTTKVDFETNDKEDIEEKLSKVKNLIDKNFRNEDNSINFDVYGADEAITVLQGLIHRKYELEKPTILQFQVTDQTENDVRDFYNLVDRYYSALEEREIAANISDFDALNEAEQAIKDASSRMLALNESTGIFAKLRIDNEGFENDLKEISQEELTLGIDLDNNTVNSITDQIGTVEVDASLKLAPNAEDELQKDLGDKTFTSRGDAKLTGRIKVSATGSEEDENISEIKNSWGLKDGQYATMLARSHYDEKLETAVVMTPITPDGQVLDKTTFQDYMERVAGGEVIEQDLVLRTYEGENADKRAKGYEASVNAIQTRFYSDDESIKKSTEMLKGYSEAQLRAIDLTDDQTSAAEDLLVSMMDAYDISHNNVGEFIDAMSDHDLLGDIELSFDIGNEGELETLEASLSEITSGKSAYITIDVDNQEEAEAVQDTLMNIPEDAKVDLLFTVSNEAQKADIERTIAQLNETRGEEYQIVANYITDETTEETQVVNVVVNGQEDVDNLNESLNNIPKNVQSNVAVEASSAIKSVDRLVNRFKALETAAKNASDATKNTSGTSPSMSTSMTHFATGTMISPAHASGTAYNMLNLKSAFADGKVSLSEDEEALVNELGTESIIRDGVWSLLPGGMHVESLKKGDIILSASQTKQLLTAGKAIGHGRAYASGTLTYGISHAYSGGGGGSRGGWNDPDYITGLVNSIKNNKSESSGGGNGNGNGNGEDEFKEVVDWIEVAIERIERLISNLDKTASAAYKSWSDRNKSLASELELVRSEIELQEDAYDRYIKEANSVGLSEDYKKLVHEGAIDIEKITDEELKEKIDQYTEWYEKALACDDAIIDLKDNMAELARQEYDNVIQEFEDKLSVIEHQKDMIEGAIDQVETKGHMVSKSFYEDLINLEKDNLSTLNSELDALTEAFDKALETGDIKEYSEEWYSMKSDINDVEKAIQESNTAIIEFKNNIRDLEWESFDKMQEMKSRIQDESDFLIDLMSDSKMYGEEAFITDEGQSTMGLHAVKYNAYMDQVNDYVKAIEELDEAYADDPLNQDYLDRRQELEDSMWDVASSAKEEKQAIKDMVSDGYDALLDYMNKVIDKRKEMLSSAKDMYDYEKNIAQQTKEIASLEKQINAYRGDDSEANRATVQKLKVQLEEARENLEQTEYDRFISDQEQMYDQIVSETEEWIDERLDKFDSYFKAILISINKDSNLIKTTLESVVGDLGLELSKDMDDIWSTNGEFDSVVDEYSNGVLSESTTTNSVLSNIESFVDRMANASDKNAGSAGSDNINNNVGVIERFSKLNDFLVSSKEADKEKQELLSLQLSSIDNRIQPYDALSIDESQLQLLQDSFLAKQSMLVDTYTYQQPSSVIKESNDVNNHVEMNITLPNVKNYEEFKYALQRDKNFEKIIQSMTLGTVTGKNSLSKLAL